MNPRIKIAIRVVCTPRGVEVRKTKRVSWREIVAFYDDGRAKDSCGEVWYVERRSEDSYEAVG